MKIHRLASGCVTYMNKVVIIIIIVVIDICNIIPPREKCSSQVSPMIFPLLGVYKFVLNIFYKHFLHWAGSQCSVSFPYCTTEPSESDSFNMRPILSFLQFCPPLYQYIIRELHSYQYTNQYVLYIQASFKHPPGTLAVELFFPFSLSFTFICHCILI